MVGASSLCTLIAGVSIVSPDARAEIARVIGGDGTGQLGALASRALDSAQMLVRLAGDYRTDNAPLIGFAILAVVLTVMMARS